MAWSDSYPWDDDEGRLTGRTRLTATNPWVDFSAYLGVYLLVLYRGPYIFFEDIL